ATLSAARAASRCETVRALCWCDTCTEVAAFIRFWPRSSTGMPVNPSPAESYGPCDVRQDASRESTPMRARVLASLVGLILVGGARVASPQPTQVLHQFTGYTSAEGPTAPLILASDGNLYGTTKQTGEAHRGTIFRMTPAGVVTTLHTFIGGADGAEPEAALL